MIQHLLMLYDIHFFEKSSFFFRNPVISVDCQVTFWSLSICDEVKMYS